MKSRTCHSSAACRPKSSSMLGRRPSARSRTVRNMIVDQPLAFGDRRSDAARRRSRHPFDAARAPCAARSAPARRGRAARATGASALLPGRSPAVATARASAASALLRSVLEHAQTRNTTISATTRPSSTVCQQSRCRSLRKRHAVVRPPRAARPGSRCSAPRFPGRSPAPLRAAARPHGEESWHFGRSSRLASSRTADQTPPSNPRASPAGSAIWSSRPTRTSSSASVAMFVRRNSASCSRYSGARSRATSSR